MLIHNNSEQYSFSSKMKKLKISWQDCKYYNSTCRMYGMYGYKLPLKMPTSIYYLITAPDSMSDFRYLGHHRTLRFSGQNQRGLTKIYQRGENQIVENHP